MPGFAFRAGWLQSGRAAVLFGGIHSFIHSCSPMPLSLGQAAMRPAEKGEANGTLPPSPTCPSSSGLEDTSEVGLSGALSCSHTEPVPVVPRPLRAFPFGFVGAVVDMLSPPPDGAREDRNRAGAGHPSLDPGLAQLLCAHVKEQQEVLALETE